MSSEKKDAEEEEWEDVVMMMELPSGANLNVVKNDLYLQVAGMWTGKPVVKLDNMLYTGTVSETLGTHFFVETDQREDKQNGQEKQSDERQTLTASTVMRLEPVYLERNTDEPGSNSSQTEGQTQRIKKDVTLSS